MHGTINRFAKNRSQPLIKMLVLLLCIVVVLLVPTTSTALQAECYCAHACGCGCEIECSCVNVICSVCEAILKKRNTPERQIDNLSAAHFACARLIPAVNATIESSLIWISSVNPVESNIRMDN